MSTFSHLAAALCYTCAAVSIISLFLPQKRTRKIFSFVIGLFVIASLIAAVRNTDFSLDSLHMDEIAVPVTDEEEYTELVKQKTAENLVAAVEELLENEGISPRDIQLSLKISDEGRITVRDVVIYISEDDFFRKQEIERIVFGNLSKEPRVYVEKEVE